MNEQEAEAYVAADNLIAQAIRERWKVLSLSGERTFIDYAGEARSGTAKFEFLTKLPDRLAEAKDLHAIELSKTKISSFREIAPLTKLEWIVAYRTLLIDLEPLSGLTSLQSLNLNFAQVSDLSALSGQTSLNVLLLNNTKVTDLSPLSGLKSLKRLEIDDTPVSDLSPLSGLTSMETIWFDRTTACTAEPSLKVISEIDDMPERLRRLRAWLTENGRGDAIEPEDEAEEEEDTSRPPPTLSDVLKEAQAVSGRSLKRTKDFSESDFAVSEDGKHLTETPLEGDVPTVDDPYRMRTQADRLSTLADLAKDLFNDIKTDQPNVPDALRRDLHRYAGELAKDPGQVRPTYLRSRMNGFRVAQRDEDIRMGLGNYAIAKFDEFVAEHEAVMAAYYGSQIARIRASEEEPVLEAATPEALEEGLAQVIELTSGADWNHYPQVPDTLSEVLVEQRDTLREERLKLDLKPADARAEGARRLAVQNRVYVATAGQAVARAVEWVADNPNVRSIANLGSATGFLQLLGRLLGF
ncbi:MAG: leucine-rich repeat domain-containing protein [Pseudomonadota bacterium]